MDSVFPYNDYNSSNRFSNLDGVEGKIIEQLVTSTSDRAVELWKLLKYDTPDALMQTPLTEAEKWALVCQENGHPTDKRVFAFPFIDDAWIKECSCVYVYVDGVRFPNQYKGTAIVTVETVTSAKLGTLVPNNDPILNPEANPNEYHGEGLTAQVVVPVKSRATVLVKDIMSLLNGMFIDGVGYMKLDQSLDAKVYCEQSLWNNRNFFGHSVHFGVQFASLGTNPTGC